MTTAAIFGRFRIVHKGHLDVIKRMADSHDKVIVGVSNKSRCQRAAHVLSFFFNNVEVVYSSTLFTLCEEFSDISHIYLGQDQAKLGTSIMKYYPVDLTLIRRDEAAPSSTLCRELYHCGATVEDYLSQGLAINDIHALTIIAQSHLEAIGQ